MKDEDMYVLIDGDLLVFSVAAAVEYKVRERAETAVVKVCLKYF